MNTQQYGNDVLGKLTDALVQDIMSTPADVLLSEVAEDHGSADVLSAEFDRIIAPMVREFCSGSLTLAKRVELRVIGGPTQMDQYPSHSGSAA